MMPMDQPHDCKGAPFIGDASAHFDKAAHPPLVLTTYSNVWTIKPISTHVYINADVCQVYINAVDLLARHQGESQTVTPPTLTQLPSHQRNLGWKMY